jgi:hypothetical protein
MEYVTVDIRTPEGMAAFILANPGDWWSQLTVKEMRAFLRRCYPLEIRGGTKPYLATSVVAALISDGIFHEVRPSCTV